jgi:hypothetical protein
LRTRFDLGWGGLSLPAFQSVQSFRTFRKPVCASSGRSTIREMTGRVRMTGFLERGRPDTGSVYEAVGEDSLDLDPTSPWRVCSPHFLHGKPKGQHFQPSRGPHRARLGSILGWLRQIVFSRARDGFLQSPSPVTTSTAGLLCFLRISPSRNRSVRSARRWMEAFRLSINWELIEG